MVFSILERKCNVYDRPKSICISIVLPGMEFEPPYGIDILGRSLNPILDPFSDAHRALRRRPFRNSPVCIRVSRELDTRLRVTAKGHCHIDSWATSGSVEDVTGDRIFLRHFLILRKSTRRASQPQQIRSVVRTKS